MVRLTLRDAGDAPHSDAIARQPSQRRSTRRGVVDDERRVPGLFRLERRAALSTDSRGGVGLR